MTQSITTKTAPEKNTSLRSVHRDQIIHDLASIQHQESSILFLLGVLRDFSAYSAAILLIYHILSNLMLWVEDHYMMTFHKILGYARHSGAQGLGAVHFSNTNCIPYSPSFYF